MNGHLSKTATSLFSVSFLIAQSANLLYSETLFNTDFVSYPRMAVVGRLHCMFYSTAA